MATPTIYLNPSGKPFTNVSGVWRGIPDLPEEYKQTATKLNDIEYNKIFRGTSGGDMPWQMIMNRLQDEATRNAPPPPAPAPAPTPNAFRPRAEGENMTSYLQAKQAHEMQTTGSSTISFGQPAQQPIPQVAAAQPPAQPAPIAPQAPVSPVAPAPAVQQPQTPQTPATGQKQYVKYAGSPDTFDRSGRYISAQEAAGIPNFFQQVEEIATPRPDIKVESDFMKLAGQNISQMVKEATQPIQPAQPITPQPTQPTQPTTEVTTGVAQKPYVEYEGSPDVFERATGRYISAEEAQKIPDFFSQVEKATTVRPGVQTEEDFAKLAKTNLQLQQSGATTTGEDFKTNPLKAFQDTYSQIWNNLGLNSVKEQIETTLKAMKEVDFEMIDKISEVNDNPWISEAERSRQVIKMQDKYEQKNKANTENLKLLQGLFETGQKEAQFVASNALDVYYKERTFDENEKLKAMDIAEKMSIAMNKKSFQDLVGLDGKMHTYIVNEAGERVVDLGVSELPKVEKEETYKPPVSYQEWELAGKSGSYADWLKEQNIKAPTQAQQTVSEYAVRIEQANPMIENLQDDIKNMNYMSFATQIKLPATFQSSNIQQYMQAARNFINAKLRRESGAVIAETEFKEARQQYLPQPGDSDEVLTQKKANRDLVYASLRNAAGNAYQSVDELLNKTGNVILEGATSSGIKFKVTQ